MAADPQIIEASKTMTNTMVKYVIIYLTIGTLILLPILMIIKFFTNKADRFADRLGKSFRDKRKK
jgi:hypothetical protein